MPAFINALSWEGWFSLGIVVWCFGMFAFTRVSPDLVTTGALTLLLVLNILTPHEALAGFSNAGMLTVGVLYVVVSGLTETGAVGWIGSNLLGQPRGPRQARLRLMLPVAAISAFLNNTPVVAIFIPAVQDWAKRYQLDLARLLIPLSYASIVGGTCTLIGTSTNLVINGLYSERVNDAGFSVFAPAWVGLPVTVATFLFLLTFGEWLLPKNRSSVVDYRNVRQYIVEMLIEDHSPLVNTTVEASGLHQIPGLSLIEIERDQAPLSVHAKQILNAGDRLVFAGIVDSVMDLQRTRGLIPATDQVFKLDTPRPGRCFVEAVVAHRCPLIGRTVRAGRFRNRYQAVIIALSRNATRIAGRIDEMTLLPGDTLLLETDPDFVERNKNLRDFLLLSQIGDQHPIDHRRAPLAILIVMAMVASAAIGWLTMLEAALLAAGAMIVTRCIDGRTARRAPDRKILLVIATSFGIGTALENTGAASLVAGGLIGLGGGHPELTLALVFVATATLTALATNNVAAVLVFPIALETARVMGVAPEALIVTLMVGASASFATHIGYQTNLMVFNVGGYQFSDFLRIGIPLTLVVGLVTVLVTPLVWGLATLDEAAMIEEPEPEPTPAPLIDPELPLDAAPEAKPTAPVLIAEPTFAPESESQPACDPQQPLILTHAATATRLEVPRCVLDNGEPQLLTLPTIDNDLVLMVQRHLADLGYDPGALDGLIGPATRDAIRRFQADHGLPETGAIGFVLLEQLSLL